MSNISTRKNIIRKNSPGLLSPVLYAIIPLLVLINLPSTGFADDFVNGASLTFAKDIIGLPLNIILIFILGKQSGLWQELRSKGGLLAAAAGMFGGPIGYTMYNTSFYIAGPSFGHVFTSLEPIILAIAVFFLYKRKFNMYIIMGIILTTLSVVALVFGSSLSSEDVPSVILGSALGILGAVSWSIEVLLFEKAIEKSATKDINILVTIKVGFACIFNVAIFFPILSTIGATDNPFHRFGSMFNDTENVIRLLLGGVLLFAARILFFISIDRVGPTISSVLYELSIVLTPIFSLIVYGVTGSFVGHDDSMLDTQYAIVFWITTIGILGGVYLVIYGQYIRDKKNKLHAE